MPRPASVRPSAGRQATPCCRSRAGSPGRASAGIPPAAGRSVAYFSPSRTAAWIRATPSGIGTMRRRRSVVLSTIFQQLAEGLHLRPAQLIDRARASAAVHAAGDRLGDVADEDRLEPRLAAADQRQGRGDAGERGEAVEEDCPPDRTRSRAASPRPPGTAEARPARRPPWCGHRRTQNSDPRRWPTSAPAA